MRLTLMTPMPMLLCAALAAGQAPEPPLDEVPEFAVDTELVRIDVVVTDDDERLVSTLSAADFVILEDGEPQQLAHFEVYRRGQKLVVADGTSDAPRQVAEDGDVEGYRRRHIVFAVDDLHISPGNLALAKQAILRFADEKLDPEDRVAVVTTSGAPGTSQGFTSDPWELSMGIARVGPKTVGTSWVSVPRISEYQAELIDRGDPLALDLAVQEILATQEAGASVEAAEQEARIRARAVRNETVQLARTSLRTLQNVMSGLAELPGRKVIVLLSDGFLLGLGTTNSQPYDLRRITDAGTRAGVVVYALDTRGLIGAPLAGDASTRGGPHFMAPGVWERVRQEGEEAVRDGMSGLARDTGGFLVANTNDLGRGLTRIVEDTETYFLLAYQPRNLARDGRFRRIEVRLPGRRDLDVRTRRGYFAPSEESEEEQPVLTAEDAGRRVATELHAALASLYARTAIPLRLSADFVSLQDGGPQLVVNANVDLSSVPFDRIEDRHVAALLLAGVVYDAGGRPITNLDPQRIDLRLEDPDYQQARRVGMKYNRTLPLEPGAYEVRLAVRDERTGMLGSAFRWIEIPELEGGALALSDVFLLKSAPGEDDAQFVDVQALPRFVPADSLVYQLQVLNPNEDVSGNTALTIQVQVLEEGRVLASTPDTPIALAQLGGVPQAYTGRIRLEALRPGEYALQVSVTDHLVRTTLLKRVAFTVQQ
jgi:VWFA-related protein